MNFVVTCVPGLEKLLSEELEELGIAVENPEEPTLGAVTFAGTWPDAARVLMGSRLASRLLLELRNFASKNPDMLYDQVRRVRWHEWIRPGQTMAVFSSGRVPSADLALSFAALKIKDAVCDEIRKHGRDRPDVDRENPDLRLEAHFDEGRCRLSLDLGGLPLHRRGERAETGVAPLRENRAAALLRLMGLRAGAEGLFVDPFCGSGTLLLEASAIAENRAPGLGREIEDFAGARLIDELHGALRAERERAEDEIRPLKLEIEGRDVESRQLEIARRNLRHLKVKLVRADLREAKLEADWVATNPPHGIRIGEVEKSAKLIEHLTKTLKQSGRACRLGLAIPPGALEKAVGLRPSGKATLQNGPEKLRLLAYEIRAGKFK